MYQPLIKFHPYPAIITQVLRIFATIGQNCPTYLTNYRSNSLSYEKTVHFLGSHHPGAGGGGVAATAKQMSFRTF